MSTQIDWQEIEAREAEYQQEMLCDLRAIQQVAPWDDIETEAGDDDRFLDVRLQVLPDGAYRVHSGSSDYDQDHRGFWGAGSIGQGMSEWDLIQVGRDLVEQVMEQVAQEHE